MKKPPASSEASPYKSVADELEAFRRTFRTLVQRYATRMEAEIAGLRDSVLAAATAERNGSAAPAAGVEAKEDEAPPVRTQGTRVRRKGAVEAERQADQIHDLRDMLTLLRTFELNPDVVKRRDFKQVENVLEEIRELMRRWAP